MNWSLQTLNYKQVQFAGGQSRTRGQLEAHRVVMNMNECFLLKPLPNLGM